MARRRCKATSHNMICISPMYCKGCALRLHTMMLKGDLPITRVGTGFAALLLKSTRTGRPTAKLAMHLLGRCPKCR